LLGLMVAAIWRYSEYVLVILASAYGVTGVVLHVIRLLRHRMVSRTA
jgi:hypothetical protein